MNGKHYGGNADTVKSELDAIRCLEATVLNKNIFIMDMLLVLEPMFKTGGFDLKIKRFDTINNSIVKTMDMVESLDTRFSWVEFYNEVADRFKELNDSSDNIINTLKKALDRISDDNLESMLEDRVY